MSNCVCVCVTTIRPNIQTLADLIRLANICYRGAHFKSATCTPWSNESTGWKLLIIAFARAHWVWCLNELPNTPTTHCTMYIHIWRNMTPIILTNSLDLFTILYGGGIMDNTSFSLSANKILKRECAFWRALYYERASIYIRCRCVSSRMCCTTI